MNHIKLTIHNSCIDCFHYMNQLFLITSDNVLKVISFTLLFDKYLRTNDDLNNKALQSFFIDNKSLVNEAPLFQNVWKYYETNEIEIKINEDDLKTVVNLGRLTILDFIVYGKKGLFACREGIFEIDLNFIIDTSRIYSYESKLTKIFDSKTIKITPRIGEVLVNTNRDGLFRASYWHGNHLKVYDKPIITDSLRSSWLKTDVINYETDYKFEIIQNEMDETKFISNLNFSYDDGIKTSKIKEFGVNKIRFDEKINSFFDFDNLVYSFNSLSYLFSIYKNGKMVALSLSDRKYSNQPFEISQDLNIELLGQPLSSHLVAKGSAIEFFNSVFCIKDNKMFKIHDGESLQIKSYSNSKNFQNLISIVSEDRISISCITPYNSKKNRY